MMNVCSNAIQMSVGKWCNYETILGIQEAYVTGECNVKIYHNLLWTTGLQ
jgi:hypothetical protein